MGRSFVHRLAWAAAAVWFGCGAAAIAGPTMPARVNVVLVHGIWDHGQVFDPVVRALEQDGHACFAPDLSPNDCRFGIRDLTRQLARDIDARFGRTAPIALVGFSMGGIVARDYVENVVKQRRRVRAVFLISSGARGTLWANLSPHPGQRQMGIGSPFLRALNADDTPWQTIPLHAYWTPFDLMIVPAGHSRWPAGQATRVLCLTHPGMVRNRWVVADIVERLRAISKTR